MGFRNCRDPVQNARILQSACIRRDIMRSRRRDDNRAAGRYSIGSFHGAQLGELHEKEENKNQEIK